MALLMSCIMSFVITLFNVGFIENVLFVWLKAWAFAFVVAFPTINLVAPIVNKLVSLVLFNRHHMRSNHENLLIWRNSH
ncbi:DUF2798 domain-containing protein [Pseudoalteromonas sp. MTN2-4]|uniref:DUF2798 domain-containing protein n=1 Tax=Pseudoalteromonas sp. MTN2-4 TaxID=3056555 RepID=UPI0036F20873